MKTVCLCPLILALWVIWNDVPLHLFSQNIRAVVEPLLGKMLGDVSLGKIMGQILKISTRFDIEVQTQFNLLQKTIVMAEGVARQLNPKADMWELSKPFAAQWVADQTRPETLIKDAKTQIQRLMVLVPKLIEQWESMSDSTQTEEPKQPQSRKTGFFTGAALIGAIWLIVHITSQNISIFH